MTSLLLSHSVLLISIGDRIILIVLRLSPDSSWWNWFKKWLSGSKINLCLWVKTKKFVHVELGWKCDVTNPVFSPMKQNFSIKIWIWFLVNNHDDLWYISYKTITQGKESESKRSLSYNLKERFNVTYNSFAFLPVILVEQIFWIIDQFIHLCMI